MTVVSAIALNPLGLLVGVGLLGVGVKCLRSLVRAKVAWWPHVAAPLLLYGPAIGLLLASSWAGGPVAFGEGADRWHVNLAWSILVFFAVTSIFAVARKFLQSHVVRDELGIVVPDLLLDGARYVLWVSMIFAVVGGIWERTDWFSTLFTASAVGTVILGFALQDTLANFFAGVSLLAERIYAPGDWVVVGGVEGEVLRISRRSTQLQTRTHDIATLANRQIGAGVVRNLSRPDGLHAEFVVLSAPYDAPPNKVRDALAAAIRACPRVLREPAPRIRLQRYADSGVEYQLKLFLRDVAGVPDILSEVQVQAWYEFRRAGISFPYPVRELRRLPDAAPTQLSPQEIRAHLQSTSLFATMPDAVLDQLVAGACTLDFGDGECIVAEGSAGDRCYVVDRGRVVVSVAGGAAQRKVAELGPGSMFGEMSLLTGEVRSASVHALGDARLLALSSDVLGSALRQHPDLAQTLAELVTLRQQGLVEARSQLDKDTRARVARESVKLGALIRRFLHLPPRG